MIFELNLSHLLVATRSDLKRYMPVLFAEGTIGIDHKWIDEEAVITSVIPGTPAGMAGLRPGYIIAGIDRNSIEQIVSNENTYLTPPFNSRNRSPGYLLGANWIRLLNGGYFMHTILQPLPSNGKIIEDNGVMPDIAVNLDRNALLEGRDTQLETAVKYIIPAFQFIRLRESHRKY